MPVRLTYTGLNDVSKPMVYALPDGDYTVNVQVKSKTDGFFPKLFIKYYEDLDSISLQSLEFPPGGEPGFFGSTKWDLKLGILNYYESFTTIKS